VKLLTSHEPLVVGRSYEMVCQAAGGRPATNLLWFLDDEILQNYTTKVIFSYFVIFIRQNVIVSYLMLLSFNLS